MTFKRSSPWAAAILVLLLIPGWICYDIRARADAILDRHGKEAGIALARLKSASRARSPLLEPSLDGNAWDCYTKAFEGIGKMPQSEQALCPILRGPPCTMDPAAFEPVWDTYAMEIDLLRQGLRCRTVEPGYVYEDGFAMSMPQISKFLTVSKFLADGAALRHGQGRDDEAADLALIGLGVSRDVGIRGPLVSHLVCLIGHDIALRSLRQVMDGHSLSAGRLERLGGRLDLLISEPATMAGSLPAEDFIVRHSLIRMATGDLGGSVQDLRGARRSSWQAIGLTAKYGFSGRLLVAEALNHWSEFARAEESIAGIHPSQRERMSRDGQVKSMSLGNPIISMLVPAWPRAWQSSAVAQLQLTLARLSLAIARHETEQGRYPASLADLAPRYMAAIPDDPLTGKSLLYVSSATSAMVYSTGKDGDDDGGRPLLNDNPDWDGDIAWTIRRR